MRESDQAINTFQFKIATKNVISEVKRMERKEPC